jgi:hypothetical protein
MSLNFAAFMPNNFQRIFTSIIILKQLELNTNLRESNTAVKESVIHHSLLREGFCSNDAIGIRLLEPLVKYYKLKNSYHREPKRNYYILRFKYSEAKNLFF